MTTQTVIPRSDSPRGSPALAAVLAGATIALSLGGTWVGWQAAHDSSDREIQANFEFRVRDAERRVTARLAAYEQVLLGAAGLFAASERVERGEFRDYVAFLGLAENYPGTQGFGFALLVPAADLDRHIRTIRREGFPDYTIRPDAPRDPYTSIVYLEPFTDRNLRAFGYDMFADPVRRAAMERARDQGGAALSGKVTLVQETTEAVQAGTLLYTAVYRKGAQPPGSVGERRARLLGWVYMPFRMGDLMRGILGERGTELSLQIHDGASPTEASLLFDSSGIARGAPPPDRLVATRSFSIAGNTWTMVVQSEPTFHARLSNRTETLVALGGGLLSVLFAGLVWVLATGRARALRLDSEMNQSRLKAEEGLREHAARQASMIGNISDVIGIVGVDGTMKYKSPNIEKWFGWRPEDLVGTDGWLTVHPDDLERIQKEFGLLLAGGGQRTVQYRYRCKDGSYKPIELTAADLTKDPAIGGVLLNYRDITEQKRAEEALRSSELRLETLAANLSDILLYELESATGDKPRRFTYLSPTFERMHGFPAEQCLADPMVLYRQLPPEDTASLMAREEVALRGMTPFVAEVRVLLPSGEIRWRQFTSIPRRSEDGMVTWSGMEMDITERKQGEEALQESRALLLESQRVAQIGHYEFDVGTDRWSSSGALDQIFGIGPDQVRNAASWIALAHPDEKAALWAYLQELLGAGTRFDRSYRIRRVSDGAIRWVQGLGELERAPDGRPLRLFGTIQDITERKQAEEARAKLEAQLQQSQKMESVGRLAGGVAHDFNNMLGVILGHAALALNEVAPASPLYADLKEIETAARRSADLTRQLLAFARKQTIKPVALDLNPTVSGLLKMLQRLLGEDIKLTWRPGPDLWLAKVDPSQLDQILANLCVNARDAITGVGQLIIETGNATIDEAYCATHPEAAPGEYVKLAVSDDGSGMDKETQSHLFEPFFTTKALGKGTGLGLATIFGIVKQSGGFFNVYSEPGSGSTFTVYLPRHLGLPLREGVEAAVAPTPRGHEIVLLVEDEPGLLKVTRRMLDRLGYTVLAAGTPGEALRLAGAHSGQIHLLMTDVVMPEMSGPDLAGRLGILRPKLKHMFMSGYTANIIAHHGVLGDGVHFIQKPFNATDLAAAVRAALDG